MTKSSLRWMLRVVGGVLVAFTLAMFVRGGLSFTVRAEQISAERYVIRHTLILPSSFIIVGLAGATLVVGSFLVGKGSKQD